MPFKKGHKINLGRKPNLETRKKLSAKRVLRVGVLAPAYKTGTFAHGDGYWCISVNGKRILEHRYIMEQHLGRKLLKSEVVDHINGIKDDNRIENLRLFITHGKHIMVEHERGKYKEHLEDLQHNYPRNERGRIMSYA